MKRTITIQAAMQEEANGLSAALNLVEVDQIDSSMGFREFKGSFGENLELSLVLQGTDEDHKVEQVGLEAAAVCAYVGIQKRRPNLIINFGTAGGFADRGCKIGEVVLIGNPIKFHDRRVPLPGYFESQEGNYLVADLTNLQKHLGIRVATLSSGSSLEMSARDKEVLREQKADIIEMEAASIAWIAKKMKVPFLAVKSVTNFVDAPELIAEHFVKNLELASLNVQNTMVETLKFLDNNTDDVIWKFD